MSSITRRSLLLLVGAAVLSLSACSTNEGNISAKEAFDLQQSGDLILVDIRTPAEWAQTGVAVGALTIDMTNPDFVSQVQALRQSNPTQKIAFICASSNRSGQVQAYLAGQDFKDGLSVVGGMRGNGAARGWIAEGLPVSAWSQN